MKIAWVTRSFLDYRIPVFAALDELCGHQLFLLYSTVITPERVHRKAQMLLGERSFGLGGEKCIGDGNPVYEHLANKTITIPLQFDLLKHIRRIRPDVIVCDGFFQWTFYAILYHLLYHTPVIMCYERTKHTERNSQWYRTLYRKMAARFFAGICCNGVLSLEYVRDVLKVPEAKLSTGHMAADNGGLARDVLKITQEEALALRRKIGLRGTVFLYVGQIIPRKGIRELLAAWKKWNAPEASLLLVGDGCEFAELRALDCNNVFWMGRKSYDEIAHYYRCADVFIIPTLEDNWSLVVPEAMACGLPVATSVYNGCYPELVTPENGWLFDPLKPGDLEATLERIVAARTEFRTMGKRSREIVQKKHTPASAAQAVWKAVNLSD